MTGIKTLLVESHKDKFLLKLKRKYTFIRGDSGTGKTYIVRLVHSKLEYNAKHVKVTCGLPVRIFTKNTADLYKSFCGILLIDEDELIKIKTSSKQEMNYICDMLNSLDAYIVLFSRDPIKFLPYAVLESYELTSITNGGFTYHEMSNLYEWRNESPLDADLIITEDSKLGFEFFSKTANTVVEYAADNSNVAKKLGSCLSENKNISNVFVVADGAAFGSYFEDLIGIKRVNSGIHIRLFLPESFEYLLLCSKIFKNFKLKERLKKTEEFADISKYVSWEKYYEKLLIEVSTVLSERLSLPEGDCIYNKKSLKQYYIKRAGLIYEAIEEIRG